MGAVVMYFKREAVSARDTSSLVDIVSERMIITAGLAVPQKT